MSFLRTLLYVVVAILASTAVFAAAHVYRYGWDAATYNGQDPWALFFFGIGGAFVPLAVATVIAGIRKLVSRSSGFLSGWLVIFAIATVLFAAPTFYVAANLNVAVMGAPALAEVGVCPISADFVTEPETRETTEQVGPVAVKITTMRAFVDGAMVQIECTEVSPDQVFPGQDDATILANYVRFWSIEPTGAAYQDGDNFAIEGTKNIQGIEVTYTYRLFRFANSFAMVATGVPGGGQPPDVERFLTSIEVTSASPEPFTAEELAEGRRNHIAACLPAVRADNEARQLGLSEVEITYFCSCTGQRYFAEFTRLELQALAMGDDAALEQGRLGIQTECFEEAIR